MIYEREFEMARELERYHRHKSPTLNAAIALVEEISSNVAVDGTMPPFTRSYILEKIDIIEKSIRR